MRRLVLLIPIILLTILLTTHIPILHGSNLAQQFYNYLKTIIAKNCRITKIETKTLATNVTTYGYEITIIAKECSEIPPVCAKIYIGNRSMILCTFRIKQNIEPIVTNISNSIFVLSFVGINPATPPVQYVYKPHLSKNILKLYTVKNLNFLIILLPSNYSLYYCTGLRIVQSGEYGRYSMYMLRPYTTLGKVITCGLISKYSPTYEAMLLLEYVKLALVCGLAVMCICAVLILRRR